MRKMMERKIASADVSMPAMDQPRNLQKEVLDGVDDQITFADVHRGKKTHIGLQIWLTNT